MLFGGAWGIIGAQQGMDRSAARLAEERATSQPETPATCINAVDDGSYELTITNGQICIAQQEKDR